MRKIYLLLVIFQTIFLLNSHAQVHTCGTTDLHLIKERLAHNQQTFNNTAFPDMVQYVPIQFHLVGDNNGKNRIPEIQVLDMMCILNQEYAEQEIQFYLVEGTFSYVDNTAINSNPNQNTSAIKNLRTPNAINVFVVNEITFAGAAAYYQSPSGWNGNDFIVVARSFVYGENVLPHEVGHFFSLLHPFHGWENNAWNESDWGNPVGVNAPSDPSIFPTNILNERQDGSNCTQAGDLICDTPPDYLFAQHPSQTDCSNWSLNVKDPANMTVNPMEENSMSYFSNCGNYGFTNDQKTAIKNDLLSSPSRDYVRSSYVPDLTEITAVPTLLFPSNGSTVSSAGLVVLQWIPLFEAEYYLIEVDVSLSFATAAYRSQIVAASVPTGIFENLQGNSTYYWRVRPFSQYYTCTGLSDRWEFNTPASVAVQEIEAIKSWAIFPNPINKGAAIHLSVNTSASFEADIIVHDLSGRKIEGLSNFHFNAGANTYSLPFDLKEGLYFLSIQNEQGISVEKILVQ